MIEYPTTMPDYVTDPQASFEPAADSRHYYLNFFT